MLIYEAPFRRITLVVKIFATVLAIGLFIVGILAVIGIMVDQHSDSGPVVFVLITLIISCIVFKASGWNIRKYKIYDDRLEIRIFGGLKTFSYPVSSLTAFNDLKVLTMSRDTGIGIVTTENEIIKILELEIEDFPEFILQLQKIVRWNLNLIYDDKAKL